MRRSGILTPILLALRRPPAGEGSMRRHIGRLFIVFLVFVYGTTPGHAGDPMNVVALHPVEIRVMAPNARLKERGLRDAVELGLRRNGVPIKPAGKGGTPFSYLSVLVDTTDKGEPSESYVYVVDVELMHRACFGQEVVFAPAWGKGKFGYCINSSDCGTAKLQRVVQEALSELADSFSLVYLRAKSNVRRVPFWEKTSRSLSEEFAGKKNWCDHWHPDQKVHFGRACAPVILSHVMVGLGPLLCGLDFRGGRHAVSTRPGVTPDLFP